MKCEICGSELRALESSLVCANGHTIQNTLEVLDDEEGMRHGRKRVVHRAKKADAARDAVAPSVATFMVFHCLFHEAMKFFNIKSDRIYKYYTCIYRVVREGGEEEQPPADQFNERIEGDHKITARTLCAVIYLSKRAEMEQGDKPYFIRQFTKEIIRFRINHRIKEIVKRLGIQRRVLLKMSFNHGGHFLEGISQKVAQIANFDGRYMMAVNRRKTQGLGFVSQHIDDAKKNIRRLFRRDVAMMTVYFAELCKALHVEQSERLLRYFRKFIYTHNFDRIFVPEKCFSIFLCLYYIDEGTFEDSMLEVRLLTYLSSSRDNLRAITRICSAVFNQRVSPETLIKLRKKEYAERFSGIKKAMWVIDTYKNALQAQSPEEP